MGVGSILLLALSSCDPKVAERGKTELAEASEKIETNVTTQAEVIQILGTPSSKGQFGEKAWYYVAQRKEGFAFFAPEIVDSQVLRITFEGDVVASKTSYNQDDMADVSFSDRKTPTEGQEFGFFEQLIGNIGKFNKQRDSVQ